MQFIVLFSLISMTLAACGGGGNSSSSFFGASTDSGANTDSGASAEQATPSPSSTLDGYSSALAAGNVSEALQYVSKYSQERQKEILESASADPYYREQLVNAIKNATKESETDRVIDYKITIITKDSQKVEDTFRLILEDGSWKLTGL